MTQSSNPGSFDIGASQNRLLLRFCVIGLCLFLAFVSGHLDSLAFLLLAIVFGLMEVMLYRRARRNTLGLRQTSMADRLPPELGNFLRVLPLPCLVVDRNLKIRYGNEEAAKAFDNPPVGYPLSTRLRMPELLTQVEIARDSGVVAQTLFVARQAARDRHYEMTLIPFSLNPTETRINFIAILAVDLSDRQTIEKMRSDFVANASHEMRTPLASILGFVETLRGPAKNDAAAREKFLAIIQDQAERMARLVDDLLSLSRIEMKAAQRPTASLDWHGLMQEVIGLLKPMAEENSVKIDFISAASPLPIQGDRDEVMQLGVNLIENAINYGGAGGKVDIRLGLDPAAQPDCIRLTIQDYGQGIAEDHIPRLTERFYRVDVEASRERKGTGLGLAIVKHILNRHGGRLKIESQVGKGTKVSVDLPSAGQEASGQDL